jgi:hypothetical protein
MGLQDTARLVFICNIADLCTDILYLYTQEFASPLLHSTAWCIFFADSLGFGLLFLFSFFLNEVMHTYVLKDRSLEFPRICSELKDTATIGFRMISMTVLDIKTQKREAIYRTGLLIHVFLHSFPMLVLQSVNNSETFTWLPFNYISCAISFSMVVLGGVISVKTKDHLL